MAHSDEHAILFLLSKIKATMNNKIQKQKKILILLVIYSNIYVQPSEK